MNLISLFFHFSFHHAIDSGCSSKINSNKLKTINDESRQSEEKDQRILELQNRLIALEIRHAQEIHMSLPLFLTQSSRHP